MDKKVETEEFINLSEDEIAKLVEDYEKNNAKKGADKAKLHDEACEHIIKVIYAKLGISEEYMKEQYELVQKLKSKNKVAQDESFNSEYEKQKQAVASATGNAKSSTLDAIETGAELVTETGKAVILALGGLKVVLPKLIGQALYGTVSATIASITASPLFGPAVLAGAVGALILKLGKKAKTAKVNKAVEGKSVTELDEDFQKMVDQLDQIKDMLERDSDYIVEQYDMFKSGALTQEDFDTIVKSYTDSVFAELGIAPKSNAKVNTKVKNKINPAGSKDKVASNPSAKSARSSKTPVEKSLNSPILMQQDESKNSINTEIITEQTIEEKEEML